MHNSADVLYERTRHVPPIQGYDDVFLHGNASGVSTKDANGEDIDIPNEKFIEILKQLPFENGAIRLCACDAGAEDHGIASYVAKEMKMRVMAPTTHIWIPFPDQNGVSEMELYDVDDFGVKDTSRPGRWRIFNIDGSIEEVLKDAKT